MPSNLALSWFSISKSAILIEIEVSFTLKIRWILSGLAFSWLFLIQLRSSLDSLVSWSRIRGILAAVVKGELSAKLQITDM